MSQYRTKPFLKRLAEVGVTSRNGGQISINTLIRLQASLKLTVHRMARDQSRVWTDEHLDAIKEHWLKIVPEPDIMFAKQNA